jgi:hypothetical protein
VVSIYFSMLYLHYLPYKSDPKSLLCGLSLS